MSQTLSKEAFVFLCALCVFSCSALLPIFSMYSWHDHQRIAEIFLLCVVCFLSISGFKGSIALDCHAIFSFFLLGLFSSLMATHSGWALIEWSRFFGLFLVVCFVAKVGGGERVRDLIFMILFLIGLFLSFQFVNYYVLAFLTGVRNLDPYFLLYGFDNPRFFGQFQVVLLPMLAVFVMRARNERKHIWCIVISSVLLIQWVMAWAMAGRGLFLGFFVAAISLIYIRKDFFKFVSFQAFFVLVGYFVFAFFFEWLPYFLEFKIIDREVLRYGLSGRETIWLAAVNMSLENPILGVGPMHYSAAWNNIAAHPHQFLLLLFSEWGVLSGLIAIYLIVKAFKRGALFVQSEAATDLDGGLWLVLVAASTLAQVDGVFIMPYGEVWLSVIIGFAVLRWRGQSGGARRRLLTVPFTLAALAVLVLVLLIDAPRLLVMEEEFLLENSIGSPPRFWGQGWIPM